MDPETMENKTEHPFVQAAEQNLFVLKGKRWNDKEPLETFGTLRNHKEPKKNPKESLGTVKRLKNFMET